MKGLLIGVYFAVKRIFQLFGLEHVLFAHPNTIQAIMIAVIAVVFGIPILVDLLLTLCGLVAFSANVVQFGIDQLRDMPVCV